MNVSLTPQLEEMIKKKVASGYYNSSSEVIREALRLLDERDQLKSLQLAELRNDIASGINSLESGEGRSFDVESIKAKGRALRDG